MKYVLKYKIRSKYFGFIREYLKEFDSKFRVFHYIINNNIKDWTLYKKWDGQFTDLLGAEENDCSR